MRTIPIYNKVAFAFIMEKFMYEMGGWRDSSHRKRSGNEVGTSRHKFLNHLMWCSDRSFMTNNSKTVEVCRLWGEPRQIKWKLH